MSEEIVKRFLSRGKLLTPEALRMVEEGRMDEIDGSFVVEAEPFSGNRIRILKNIAAQKKEMTTDDFVSFYRTKYEKIKAMLMDKLQKDFVSLNKLDNFREEQYVIGVVRDVREKDGKKVIELDDTTASVPIIFDEAQAEAGDVVAARAISARSVMFGKEIIYPDVPLRAPANGRGRACFVSGLMIDEAPEQDVARFFSWFSRTDIQFLFVTGRIGDTSRFGEYAAGLAGRTVFVANSEPPSSFSHRNIVPLSNPSMVEVNGVKILLTASFTSAMLKKRYLGDSTTANEGLILNEIPDIVCHAGRDAHISNYKSITIVTSGSMLSDFSPVVIDLETRDARHEAVV